MDKTLYVECPVEDFSCPYWSWKLQKCKMKAIGEGDPHEECDAFFGEEDEDDD